MIYAHDWEILGDVRIRRWPSATGEKRPLRVTINTWKGISVGADHYNITVQEANNCWWSEKEDDWVELSCDSKNRGYDMQGHVNTVDEAVKFAEFCVELIAGKDRAKHDVHWSGPGAPGWVEGADDDD